MLVSYAVDYFMLTFTLQHSLLNIYFSTAQLFNLNFADLDFVTVYKPCVLAIAVGTCLSVFHRFILLFAVVAPGDSWDNVAFQLATLQQLLFVGGPTPAVGEQVRHHRGDLPNVHDHGGNMFHVVFRCHRFDIADNVEDDTQFVHIHFVFVSLRLLVTSC